MPERFDVWPCGALSPQWSTLSKSTFVVVLSMRCHLVKESFMARSISHSVFRGGVSEKSPSVPACFPSQYIMTSRTASCATSLEAFSVCLSTNSRLQNVVATDLLVQGVKLGRIHFPSHHMLHATIMFYEKSASVRKDLLAFLIICLIALSQRQLFECLTVFGKGGTLFSEQCCFRCTASTDGIPDTILEYLYGSITPRKNSVWA